MIVTQRQLKGAHYQQLNPNLWKTMSFCGKNALNSLIKGLINVYALFIPLLRMFSGYYPLLLKLQL